MIAALLLSLSFALICFWLGWRAHLSCWLNNCLGSRHEYGGSASFDAELWTRELFAPVLALFIWFGFLIFCLGRGYL